MDCLTCRANQPIGPPWCVGGLGERRVAGASERAACASYAPRTAKGLVVVQSLESRVWTTLEPFLLKLINERN